MSRPLFLAAAALLVAAAAVGHLWVGGVAFVALVAVGWASQSSLTAPERVTAALWLIAGAGVVVVGSLILTANGLPTRFNPFVALAGLGAATVAPFLWRRHALNRGHQVGLGVAVVVAGCGAGNYSALAQFVVTFVGLAAVQILTGRGAVWLRRLVTSPSTRGIPVAEQELHPDLVDASEQNLLVGAEAEIATAQELSPLRGDWRILHSRRLPGTSADVDHLVMGLGGVIVVDSKDWKGRMRAQEVLVYDSSLREPKEADFYRYADADFTDDDWENAPELYEAAKRAYDDERARTAVMETQWLLDGSEDRTEKLVGPGIHEAAAVVETLGVHDDDAMLIVAVGERMKLPQPVLEYTWRGDGSNGLTQLRVAIMHQSSLVGFIRALPARQWKEPGLVTRLWGRVRGLSEAEVAWRSSRRWIADLAAQADYSLPPKTGA